MRKKLDTTVVFMHKEILPREETAEETDYNHVIPLSFISNHPKMHLC